MLLPIRFEFIYKDLYYTYVFHAGIKKNWEKIYWSLMSDSEKVDGNPSMSYNKIAITKKEKERQKKEKKE